MKQADDAFALAEYTALLAGIQAHLDEITQLYRFTITAVAAIIAWGISQRSWLILLTPAPLLTFSIIMMLSHSETVFRISTYIREFIEPQHSSLRWETRLAEAASRRGLVEVLHNSAVGVSYLGLSAFSLYMSWIYAGNPEPLSSRLGGWAVFAVATVCAAFALFAVWRIIVNRRAPDRAHLKIWAEIAENESRSVRAPRTGAPRSYRARLRESRRWERC